MHSLEYSRRRRGWRYQGNSRGVHWRSEGGDQERELAEKYRKWGQALQVSHPFVAAKLLMGLAQTYDHDASREDTEAGACADLRSPSPLPSAFLADLQRRAASCPQKS
jgi:hypothetical protein